MDDVIKNFVASHNSCTPHVVTQSASSCMLGSWGAGGGGGRVPHRQQMSASRRAFRRAVASALGDAYRRASHEPQLSSLLVGAVAGAAAGAGLTLWLAQQGRLPPELLPRSTAHAHHPAAAAGGLPTSTETIRTFEGFVSCWDSRTRNPKWVMERLRADELRRESVGNRADVPFVEDSALEARFRARLDDYRGSGYDRGHLAPAGNHKSSQRRLEETFTLSNVSPQVGAGFNRDYWARLEKFVKDLTKRYDDVYIVTGPLFLPTRTTAASGGIQRWRMEHDVIGTPPRLISVPTHFYKVVLATRKSDDSAAVAAFVVPNAPVPPEYPLSACVVPLHELEDAAGMIFFPEAPSLKGERMRAMLAQQEEEWIETTHPERRAALSPGGPPMLLLPPPSAGSDHGNKGMPARAADVTPVDIKAVGRAGPVALCAETACTLPAPNWWAKGKGTSEAK